MKDLVEFFATFSVAWKKLMISHAKKKKKAYNRDKFYG